MGNRELRRLDPYEVNDSVEIKACGEETGGCSGPKEESIAELRKWLHHLPDLETLRELVGPITDEERSRLRREP